MTEQELRDEFDSWYKQIESEDGHLRSPTNKYSRKAFLQGFSLAQETIKAKNSELGAVFIQLKGNAQTIADKDKAIAEAREILKTSLGFNGIKSQIENEKKARAWLEVNK